MSLQDGAYLRTRVGLRGDKPVAEGYTFKFQLEQGLNDTTGAQADATRLFDRQLWAGLATPIGEFRVGRNTAVFYKGGYIDNTTRTLGSVINAFGVRFALRQRPRLPLAAARASSSRPIRSRDRRSTTRATRPSGSLEWAGGPWRFGYAGVYGEPPDNAVVPDKVKYDNVYANWDYGKGKVYLAFVRSNNNGRRPARPASSSNGARRSATPATS